MLLEHIDSSAIERLVDRLEAAGMWGPAMPLDSMEEPLEDNIWVARDAELVPHLEVKTVDDEYDRSSLENRITARLSSVGAELPIGPLELQIAYKLYLGTPTDFEDAVHLYSLFEENLSTPGSNTGLRNSAWRTSMSDSNERDELEAKHEHSRQQHIASVKRWVEYIESHSPEEWGDQQNRLVDSQLESARQSDIDIELRRRVERSSRDRSP